MSLWRLDIISSLSKSLSPRKYPLDPSIAEEGSYYQKITVTT